MWAGWRGWTWDCASNNRRNWSTMSLRSEHLSIASGRRSQEKRCCRRLWLPHSILPLRDLSVTRHSVCRFAWLRFRHSIRRRSIWACQGVAHARPHGQRWLARHCWRSWSFAALWHCDLNAGIEDRHTGRARPDAMQRNSRLGWHRPRTARFPRLRTIVRDRLRRMS